MANTRFLPFPKLLYIIRVRVLVEPAGDKPFSFFFSVPGKDSIDRIEIRLQFLLRREEEAAIGGRKSLSVEICGMFSVVILPIEWLGGASGVTSAQKNAARFGARIRPRHS